MSVYYNGKGQEIKTDLSASEIVKVITQGCPTFFITSDTAYADVTKENKSKGVCKFVSGGGVKFELPVQFKLQGNSSLVYPKHNFNITFYADDTYEDKQKIQFDGWYPANKYVIKANYSDRSWCNNSVGGKITHDFVGKNYPLGARGMIDSFPCIVVYNGEWMGCHTMNLYQDGKLFNFSKKKEQAHIHEAWRNDQYNSFTPETWEYRGDEEDTATTDLVAVPLGMMNSPSSLTKEDIESVFNKDSLLNYMVMADILYAVDRFQNNTTLVTWDGGASWYLPFYDLDQITPTATNSLIAAGNPALVTDFFNKVTELYADEYPVYYAKFRDGGLNADVLYQYYEDFAMKWGYQNFDADHELWFPDEAYNGLKAKLDGVKAGFVNRQSVLDELYGYNVS